MPARFIAPTDVIEVQQLPILIYGPPGTGKSSLAQTAADPFTLDFDMGIHRIANRRAAAQFGSWQDVIDAGEQGLKDEDGNQVCGPRFDPFKTLILDTGGRALDMMIASILNEDAKYNFRGSLTIQGYGVLGNRFAHWMRMIRSWGKDVVMICHQEEGKDANDTRFFMPDMPGKMSYKEVHKVFDMIGSVYYVGKRRFLNFSPSDIRVGKNAAAFEEIEVPDLHANKTFLADLIARAKKKIGSTAEASAAVAQTVERWEKWAKACASDLTTFNSGLRDLSDCTGAAKKQAWTVIERHAEAQGWAFDKAKKEFQPKGGS